MTFKYSSSNQAFVWVWLPNNAVPICAGRIRQIGDVYQFKYGKKYLANSQAIALSPFEVPLLDQTFIPTGLNKIHSCLRDAAPDAWGRRVINNEFNLLEASEIDYMLLSGSNRVGALDFQLSDSNYVPRINQQVAISDLMNAAEFVEKNLPIPKQLQAVLLYGTSIGGARPKALIDDQEIPKEYIAKFSSSTDIYNHIKAEYVCMRLAKLAGINVATVHLKSVLDKEILLVERFDREYVDKITSRKLMLSGLSILSLNEMEARYASYPDLAEKIRQRFAEPKRDLLELFKRLVFNILIGNTDDHARNHAAFWDGKNLNLTPAYDLCPQPRFGQEASQAMRIDGCEGNLSKLTNVISICEYFQLGKEEAQLIVNSMIQTIKDNWLSVCTEANLNAKQQEQLWGASILNPFCFQ
jgi:serine/threonine-protein kinase HipA